MLQYCLPTDSPDLKRQFGVVRSAMSPMLWSRFKPDRFDSWSAGALCLSVVVSETATPLHSLMKIW